MYGRLEISPTARTMAAMVHWWGRIVPEVIRVSTNEGDSEATHAEFPCGLTSELPYTRDLEGMIFTGNPYSLVYIVGCMNIINY